MSRKSLEDLLAEDDELGLLDVKPLPTKTITDVARVLQSFEEINAFIDRSGRVPGQGEAKPTISERQLAMRLQSIITDPLLLDQVQGHDRHGLLADALAAQNIPETLDEILSNDEDWLIGPADEIFTLKYARNAAAKPDKISERKPCEDFKYFQPLFNRCIEDIGSGKRKTIKFAREQEIRAGEFFILNGVMVFVAEVRDPHIRNGKRNARLRLIFENGTEGQNLLRSLARELYKDKNGRRVTHADAGPLFTKEDSIAAQPHDGERVTGHIYVVRSLSADPVITQYDGKLFKIGFTSGDVNTRLRSAKDDPTFLLAPVHPVRTYATVDMSVSKFETLLHRFFGNARLDIEILDRFGKPFRPKEWFLIPMPIIERAIAMMLDGSILGHYFDPEKNEIVKVANSPRI